MSAPAAATPVDTGSPPTKPRADDVVLLTCNDLHLTDVAPAARLDNYVDEMFGLLDQIAQAAEKTRANAVCIAGDIFHSKDRPMGAPLLGRLVDWCKRLERNGTAVLIVPGNHDLRYNNLDTLPLQPLGVLLKAGVMRDVSTNPFYGPPPERDWGPHYEVWGVPFPHAFDLDHWRALGRLTPLGDRRRIVLAHCFASPTGGTVYGEPELSYSDIAEACPADVYVFGHDHSDGGVSVLDGDRPMYFVNLGAISRGTIGHDDITREIHLGLVRIGAQVSVSRVRLNAIPASDLFDLTTKAEQTAQAQRIDTFIADLEATLASLDSTAPITTHLGRMQIADAVKARMQAYITAIEHG